MVKLYQGLVNPVPRLDPPDPPKAGGGAGDNHLLATPFLLAFAGGASSAWYGVNLYRFCPVSI